MFSRLFGKKEKEASSPYDLSNVAVDMHSHLIPGIDDGSQSMDETIAMMAKFESLGFKKLITTPHVMSDYYRNTPEIILSGLEKVKQTAKELNLSIEIEAAAEYYFDDALINMLENKEQLLTFGDNYLLFEFSFMTPPSNIEHLFFELQSQDYKPILAHFERYIYYHGSVEKAKEFRDRGINIQMNFNSLTGHYGPQVKEQAEALIDNKLIDFVASDCHRIQHLGLLENNLKRSYFHKMGELELKNTSLL